MFSVCHIISGDLWAGAEVMAFNLMIALNKSNQASVCAIVLNQGTLADKLKSVGIRVDVVDESEFSLPDILLRIRTILAETAPDIVHTHRYKENLLAFWAGGFSGRIKLITTLHGMPETVSHRMRSFKKMVSWLNLITVKYGFHRFICVSEDLMKKNMHQYGMRAEKGGVIHNGIPLHLDVTARKDSSLVTIGSAGRFYPVKDFLLMIDVARELVTGDRRVRFKLAGDGPMRQQLKDRVEKYGLSECFDFIGHEDDMPSFYNTIDIYINTSVHEGLPMTLLEAMSYGVPVVASDVGGIGEMISNGEDGFLVKNRNPDEFVRIINLLCEDSDVRNKIAVKALETVQDKFSSDVMAKAYFMAYHEMVYQTKYVG